MLPAIFNHLATVSVACSLQHGHCDSTQASSNTLSGKVHPVNAPVAAISAAQRDSICAKWCCLFLQLVAQVPFFKSCSIFTCAWRGLLLLLGCANALLQSCGSFIAGPSVLSAPTLAAVTFTINSSPPDLIPQAQLDSSTNSNERTRGDAVKRFL